MILPKQGIYEGDVELIEWLVPDRSQVSVGMPLYLLGTDKVEVEVEADEAGWVIQVEQDGYSGPIGTTVGYIVTDEADLA